MRRLVLLAAILGTVAMFMAAPVPARSGLAEASLDEVIQPGAAASPGHTPLGPFSPCTLNFVFEDAAHTYIGTAGRCTYEVGERVTNSSGEFGTVVYRVMSASEAAPEKYLGPLNQAPIDDFALIRIDTTKLGSVSPVVLGFGAAPTGFTTSDATEDGAVLTMTAQGVGLSAHESTRTRTALLVADDQQGYKMLTAASPGDSGAPLVHASDGKALGVMSALGVPATIGTTVERVLALLRDAGFNVSLVTA